MQNKQLYDTMLTQAEGRPEEKIIDMEEYEIDEDGDQTVVTFECRQCMTEIKVALVEDEGIDGSVVLSECESCSLYYRVKVEE